MSGIAITGIVIMAFFGGIVFGLFAAADAVNRQWLNKARQYNGKEFRVGQDVYRVEYVRSEPKEWK